MKPAIGAYGAGLARYFRADASSQVVTSALRKAKLAVTRIRRTTPGHGMTSSLPPEAAFSVLLQLRDSPKRELVNVKTGRNQPTIYQITDVLHGVKPVDRTAINAWEDEDFVRAVKATNRKKLVMAALWTEVCLVHPALDAMAEGFEVYPVVDCVGGTSREAHELGVQRIVQAGARPLSRVQLICELQRDWNRERTVPEFAEILFAVEGH